MQAYGIEAEDWNTSALSIVVVGASGDLARKKILPALFALYHEGMLPKVLSPPLINAAPHIAVYTKPTLDQYRSSCIYHDGMLPKVVSPPLINAAFHTTAYVSNPLLIYIQVHVFTMKACYRRCFPHPGPMLPPLWIDASPTLDRRFPHP